MSNLIGHFELKLSQGQIDSGLGGSVVVMTRFAKCQRFEEVLNGLRRASHLAEGFADGLKDDCSEEMPLLPQVLRRGRRGFRERRSTILGRAAESRQKGVEALQSGRVERLFKEQESV